MMGGYGTRRKLSPVPCLPRESYSHSSGALLMMGPQRPQDAHYFSRTTLTTVCSSPAIEKDARNEPSLKVFTSRS